MNFVLLCCYKIHRLDKQDFANHKPTFYDIFLIVASIKNGDKEYRQNGKISHL